MSTIQITSGFQLTELIGKVLGQIEKSQTENKDKWRPLFEIMAGIVNDSGASTPLSVEALQAEVIPFMLKGNLGLKFKTDS